MQRISLKWQNLQLTVKRVYDYTFEVTRIYWYDGYYVKVLPDGTKIQNIRSCSVKNDVTIKCKTYHLSRYYEHLVTRYSITVEKKRWKVCCPVLKLLINLSSVCFTIQKPHNQLTKGGGYSPSGRTYRITNMGYFRRT